VGGYVKEKLLKTSKTRFATLGVLVLSGILSMYLTQGIIEIILMGGVVFLTTGFIMSYHEAVERKRIEDLKASDQMVNELIETLDNKLTQQNENNHNAVTLAIQQLSESFKDDIKTLEDLVKTNTEEMKNIVNKNQEELKLEMTSHSTDIKGYVSNETTTLENRLTDINKELKSNLSSLDKSLQERSTKLSEKIIEISNKRTDEMNTLKSQVDDSKSDNNRSIENLGEKLSQEMNAIEEQLNLLSSDVQSRNQSTLEKIDEVTLTNASLIEKTEEHLIEVQNEQMNVITTQQETQSNVLKDYINSELLSLENKTIENSKQNYEQLISQQETHYSQLQTSMEHSDAKADSQSSKIEELIEADGVLKEIISENKNTLSAELKETDEQLKGLIKAIRAEIKEASGIQESSIETLKSEWMEGLSNNTSMINEVQIKIEELVMRLLGVVEEKITVLTSGVESVQENLNDEKMVISEIEKQLNNKLEQLNLLTNEIDTNQASIKTDINALEGSVKKLIQEKYDELNKSLLNHISKQNTSFTDFKEHQSNLSSRVQGMSTFIKMNYDETSSHHDNTEVMMQSLNQKIMVNELSQKSSFDALTSHIDKVFKFSKKQPKHPTKSKPSTREEMIEDPAHNAVLKDFYKDDIKFKSQLFVENLLKYETHYDKGRIIASKSYNENGSVTVEDDYYPSGAIKERVEYIYQNNDVIKEVSNYDKNGNKL